MSEVNSDHSVSNWLTTINASHGEAETAWRRLWDRYAPGMTALARERLAHRRKPLADEEDVVIEAFKDLFRGVQGGCFGQLTNRDDLQQILITITHRRAIDAVRRNEFRAAHEAGESALPFANSGESSGRPMDRVPAAESPPELPLLAGEELARLLDRLEDDTLRQVAVMRVFSSTTREIAQELGFSVRTAERKLEVIARRWRKVAALDSLSLRELWQAFECWRQTDEPP